MAKRKSRNASPDEPEGTSGADYARAATNLVVVDLAMRAGSLILRNAVEKRVLGKDISKPAAEAVMKQSSFAGRMARVAAARLATIAWASWVLGRAVTMTGFAPSAAACLAITAAPPSNERR